MIACPECGRPLEPFDLTSSDGERTWVHQPWCWHPDVERVYGKEMTVEHAIELATWQHEEYMEQVEEMSGIIADLNTGDYS